MDTPVLKRFPTRCTMRYCGSTAGYSLVSSMELPPKADRYQKTISGSGLPSVESLG